MTLSTLPALLRDLPARLRRVTSGDSYVPQIDGLRFLAIIPVLFWHSGLRGYRAYDAGHDVSAVERTVMSWLPHGHVGVELFFFISGYIIAYPFLAGRAPKLRRFFGRRALRIEPPYVLVIVACFVMLAVTGFTPTNAPSFHRTEAPLWQSLVASLFYVHGLTFNATPRLNPPAWSLEVEVQFYLLSPFLLMALARLRAAWLRRGGIAAMTVAAWVISSTIFGQDHETVHRWTLIGHAWPFLLGILVCDFAVASSPFKKPVHALYDLGLVAALIVLALSGHYEERISEVGEYLLRDAVRAVCIVLIYMGAARGPLGRKVTGAPWIALIGGACYSLYLTHVPLMQIVSEILFRLAPPSSLAVAWGLAFSILIPLSLVVGMIFYALIERPCTLHDWPLRAYRGLVSILSRRADPVLKRAVKDVGQ